MYGMHEATPEYRRAVLGAFAHVTFMAGIPDVKITVDDEPDASLYRSAFRMGAKPLRVTVSCPYGRDDPRGPNSGESTHMTFDKQGRMVRSRPPAQVGAVVPQGLAPSALQLHALATRARLDRELARGYGVIHTSAPPPDHIAADRKLLPEHACWHPGPPASDQVVKQLLAMIDGEPIPVADEEEVDGELVDDTVTFGGDPAYKDVTGLRAAITRDPGAPPSPYGTFTMRGEKITSWLDKGPSLADRVEREIHDRALAERHLRPRPPFMPEPSTRIYIDPDKLDELLADPDFELASRYVSTETLARMIDDRLGLR